MSEPTNPDGRARSGAEGSRDGLRRRAIGRIWAPVAGILAVGWGVAIAVYVTVAPVVEDELVEDWEHSRRYVREIERIGGKAAVFANDMNRWLASLWQGRTLAYTIALITAAVALGWFLVARALLRRGSSREPS